MGFECLDSDKVLGELNKGSFEGIGIEYEALSFRIRRGSFVQFRDFTGKEEFPDRTCSVDVSYERDDRCKDLVSYEVSCRDKEGTLLEKFSF